MPEPARSDGSTWERDYAENTVMVRSSGDLVFKYIFKFTKSIFNVNSLFFKFHNSWGFDLLAYFRMEWSLSVLAEINVSFRPPETLKMGLTKYWVKFTFIFIVFLPGAYCKLLCLNRDFFATISHLITHRSTTTEWKSVNKWRIYSGSWVLSPSHDFGTMFLSFNRWKDSSVFSSEASTSQASTRLPPSQYLIH